MDKAYPYICAGLALMIPATIEPGVPGWQVSLMQAAFVAVGFYGRKVLSH